MGEQSKISWTDSTVNFWSGCTKVSAGCHSCYAEALSNRGLTDSKGKLTIGKWGKGAPRQLHESAFKLAHKLNRKPWVTDCCGESATPYTDYCPKCLKEIPLNKGVHRRRIFSLSLGDWLDPEVPVGWLARMLDTVNQCQGVDWILCTKRPELFNARLEAVDASLGSRSDQPLAANWLNGNPPNNVVVLTSVENQQAADKRIPELLRIPARWRGLSCEPLLGPVELSFAGIVPKDISPRYQPVSEMLHWVIIGGESGNKSRPCNLEWIRSLRDQCKAASVPCFVKQLGAHPVGRWTKSPEESGLGQGWPAGLKITDKKGGDWNEWPDDLRVREFYND